MIPVYPDCSTCGHNASGVAGFQCTTFVAPPHGADFPVAICGCRCADDPVIKAWMHTPTGRERPLREGGETAP